MEMDDRFLHTTKMPTAVKVSGRKLAQALKSGALSPELAARLAYGLMTGAIVASKLPARWARAMTGATRAGLAAERRAHQRTNGTNGNGGPRVFYRHNLTDATVDTVVHQIGLERLMAALDRATHPTVTINGR